MLNYFFYICRSLSTLFFFGKFGFCPGTIGSALGLFTSLALAKSGCFVFFLFLAALMPLSLYSIDLYIKSTENKDPPEVIIDEFFAQMLTIYALLVFFGCVTVRVATCSFFIFRLLDILKPFPISYFDKKLSGAFGVMFDDVLAGFGAFVATASLVWMGFL